MGFASIDIPQMRSLVTDLVNARYQIEVRRKSIANQLLTVQVSGEPLLRLFTVEGWLDDQVPGIRRRLALAEGIEAQTPGSGTIIQIDEALVSTATVEEARAAARRAAELIAAYGTDPLQYDDLAASALPAELLTLLAENSLDPYFAAELARTTSADDVASLVKMASELRLTVAASSQIDLTVAEVDEQYDALLWGLGESLGLASRGTGELALPSSWGRDWIATMTDLPQSDLALAASRTAALSLVMSRGTWSPDLVMDTADALYGVELAYGPDAWAGLTMVAIVTPGGYTYTDPLAGVLAAASIYPEVTQELFDDSHVTSVTIDGQVISLTGFLEYSLRRHWPSDDGAALSAALSSATTPYVGGSTISNAIAADAAAVYETMTAEYEAATAEAKANDHGWFSTLGHLLLDVLGFVPFLGEPADGANAAWYTAEGNYTDAALSSAGMVVGVGWAAVGGKWVRRANSAEELLEIERRFGNLAVDAEGAEITAARVATGGPTGGVFGTPGPTGAAGPGTSVGDRLAAGAASPSDYGVAFFGPTSLKYYTGPTATLGTASSPYFHMPIEDAAMVRTADDALRATGRSPSLEAEVIRNGLPGNPRVFGLSFPLNGLSPQVATSADAGGWPHYLPGGHTAIRMEDAPGMPGTGGYLVNPTREAVIRGGLPVPNGSVLFELMPEGSWSALRRFP